MVRIFFGVALFCAVAYTIGYFWARFKKTAEGKDEPRTPLQIGTKVLILMIGLTAILFALFVAYTFGSYLFKK